MNTHQSIWEATVDAGAWPRLEAEVEADVAVVGAGITGLTAALLLSRAGKRVVVIDAERIGSGTTGRTTAHVSTLWDGRYHRIEKLYGDTASKQIAASLRSAVDRIETFVREHSIDCSFERLPGYQYAERNGAGTRVGIELEAAKRAGLDVSPVNSIPLPLSVAAAFRIEGQAQLHPLRYLQGLAGAIEEAGGRIYENTRAVNISDGAPGKVHTASGVVLAEEIILATHMPIGLNPVQTELAPMCSYVLAAKVKNDIGLALFWDMAEPYNYLRSYTTSDERWLLVGGQDLKTGHGKESAAFDRLRRYVESRFEVEDIRYLWSAELYEPTDRLPFIGRSPFAKHVWLATGFSGDGIPFGTMAGMLLRDEILERPNANASLYRPTRLKLGSVGKTIEHNAHVVRSLVSDRLKTWPEEIDQLPPGQGCVTGSGMSKTAVFKNEAGELSMYSAVCPHMKCIVRWNDAERSFDCPCHGSRFATDGSVIAGPALKGLSPVKRPPQPEEERRGGLRPVPGPHPQA